MNQEFWPEFCIYKVVPTGCMVAAGEEESGPRSSNCSVEASNLSLFAELQTEFKELSPPAS